jgi:serine/threonine-protein kinase RsbW
MVIEEKISSHLGKMSQFIAQVVEKLRRLSLRDEEVFDIRLSLEEALTNAMRHGNQMDPSLYVEVHVHAAPDKVVIEVKDQGEGFDAGSTPDPTHQENVDQPSGRGIFLIRHLMDEVVFFNSGSGIRMIKYVGGKQ